MDETPENAAEYFKRSLGHQLKHQEKLIDKLPFKDTDHVFEIGWEPQQCRPEWPRRLYLMGK